jgi:hypothetical protein
LVTLLRGLVIVIAKRQIVRLLIACKQRLLDQARAVLRPGLTYAAWITVDDTGARHKGKNGFCKLIGNARLTWFPTTNVKSRVNIRELLRMRRFRRQQGGVHLHALALAGTVIDRPRKRSKHTFADWAAWMFHLHRIGATSLKANPDSVQIAKALCGVASTPSVCSPIRRRVQ